LGLIFSQQNGWSHGRIDRGSICTRNLSELPELHFGRRQGRHESASRLAVKMIFAILGAVGINTAFKVRHQLDVRCEQDMMNHDP